MCRWSLLLCTVVAQAQVITTVVGTNPVFPGGSVPAATAPLKTPTGVALDSAGNLYAADVDNHIVARISTNGILTVIAGNGRAGFSGDGGPGTGASLNRPTGVALDAAGNLYIADSGNSRI